MRRRNLAAIVVVVWVTSACDGVESTVRMATDPPDADVESKPDAGGTPEDAAMSFAAMWREFPLHTSGKRLRANLADAGGSAAYLRHYFHDALYDVDCELARAADAETRCLPVDDTAAIRYLDPGCTQPVYVTQKLQGSECEAPRRAICGNLESTSSCDARGANSYEVGPLISSQVAFARNPEGCVPDRSIACLFELEPIPPQMFVRAEVHTEIIDDRLALDWVEYEDGARQSGAIRDRMRDGAACASRNIPERCSPDSAAYREPLVDFTDAACTNPGEIASTASCGSVTAAYSIDSADGCAQTGVFFEIGPAVPDSFRATDAGCEALPRDPMLTFYSVGDRIDPNTFPRLVDVRAGMARLKLNYVASPEGRPLATSGSFYDSQLDSECVPFKFRDQVLRCVPTNTDLAYLDGIFSDPQCEHAIVGAHDDPCTGKAIAVVTQSPDGLIDTVRRLGPDLTEVSRAFHRIEDTCAPLNLEANVSFHLLAEPLELAVVTYRIE